MNQAARFVEFMTTIWDNPMRKGANGSIHIVCHPHYDYWHNARQSAIRKGAFKRWANRVAGQPGHTYEFPDGSRVNIGSDGGAVTAVQRHSPKD